MDTQNLFTEDESYYDVVDVIQEVVEEVLNSNEVKQMFYQKFREKQLDVVLPDVDFSENFGDEMSKIIDDYLLMGSVINGREYKPFTDSEKKIIEELKISHLLT